MMAGSLPTPDAARPDTALVPAAPALAVLTDRAGWLDPEGELARLDLAAAAERCRDAAPLLVHARASARRLGLSAGLAGAFDLLELFAFARPAQFCLPTARGLAELVAEPARAPAADDAEGAAAALPDLAARLLGELGDLPAAERERAAGIAWHMGRGGWPWATAVLAALGHPDGGGRTRSALRAWDRLGEWHETGPGAPPETASVSPEEARRRLAELRGRGGLDEDRPQQGDYASSVTPAFAPRPAEDTPNVVLAEAGTGVGKTLGYLAPAGLWSEKTGGSVWITTYTRNLQHQIDSELDRRYPDPADKADKVVVRKGRENYLCLLNFDEAVQGVHGQARSATAVGLMARWVEATRDGDLGGDLPNWLVELVGRPNTVGLSDRRGECIYAACPHYGKCFIESSHRKARKADIVVGNHALAMIQAARGDDPALPQRYVFDEGHHLFDAADQAFAQALTGQEAAELRRWLLGAEGARSRARGLQRRIEDLVEGDDASLTCLNNAVAAARALPGEGWRGRVMPAAADRRAAAEARGLWETQPDAGAELPPGYMPTGAAERFLAHGHTTVLARAPGVDGPYSLETPASEPPDGLVAAAQGLDTALGRLTTALEGLVERFRTRLDEEADQLDSTARTRLEAMARSIRQRALEPVKAWRGMLALFEAEPASDFVDWLEIARHDGRELDVGLHRHWIDPTRPFAATIQRHAHGVVVTSATLTDGTGEGERDWAAAELRSGAGYLPAPPVRAQVASPFHYSEQTRVLVVTDVRKDDFDQVAAAYRSLFRAAGGGALGLFTAIARLKAVHQRVAGPLAQTGLPLYAQHVEALDTTTLIDIFRAETQSCLLGTDAVRDGIDVPGDSLRLIVFDRVPWPRPSLLHRARRDAFGKRRWDDLLTRLRLKQAFGRLIRRGDDRGCFVLLDPMMPSRLFGAFPEGVQVQRVGLKDAVREINGFLS